MKPLCQIPLIDGHIHYGHPRLLTGLMEILDGNRVERFNVVCTPHRERLSLVPDALHLKAHSPRRVYVHGARRMRGALCCLPGYPGGDGL